MLEGSVRRVGKRLRISAQLIDALIAVAHDGAGRFAEAVRCSAELLTLRPGFQGAKRWREIGIRRSFMNATQLNTLN